MDFNLSFLIRSSLIAHNYQVHVGYAAKAADIPLCIFNFLGKSWYIKDKSVKFVFLYVYSMFTGSKDRTVTAYLSVSIVSMAHAKLRLYFFHHEPVVEAEILC